LQQHLIGAAIYGRQAYTEHNMNEQRAFLIDTLANMAPNNSETSNRISDTIIEYIVAQIFVKGIDSKLDMR